MSKKIYQLSHYGKESLKFARSEFLAIKNAGKLKSLPAKID
ncbi:hypothetical protein EV05_0019 [Prochlorococcus sp. MIT 0601]|nr:hypothetical protein EV05_0019 [Prochlorococcus sp. MIT 0601]